MTLEQLRDVKNGDIVAVHGLAVLSKMIYWTQTVAGLKDYASTTHLGIAWWLEGELCVVEMYGLCNIIRPIGQYLGLETLEIYRCPVPSDNMRSHWAWAINMPIGYSLLEGVWASLLAVMRLRGSKDGEGAMACSMFVARWLAKAGWQPPADFPQRPLPGHVCRALGQPFLRLDKASLSKSV
jgi:hypothetical protein